MTHIAGYLFPEVETRQVPFLESLFRFCRNNNAENCVNSSGRISLALDFVGHKHKVNDSSPNLFKYFQRLF